MKNPISYKICASSSENLRIRRGGIEAQFRFTTRFKPSSIYYRRHRGAKVNFNSAFRIFWN